VKELSLVEKRMRRVLVWAIGSFVFFEILDFMFLPWKWWHPFVVAGCFAFALLIVKLDLFKSYREREHALGLLMVDWRAKEVPFAMALGVIWYAVVMAGFNLLIRGADLRMIPLSLIFGIVAGPLWGPIIFLRTKG